MTTVRAVGGSIAPASTAGPASTARAGPGSPLGAVGAVLAVGWRRHRAGVGDVLRHLRHVRDGADRRGLVARGGGVRAGPGRGPGADGAGPAGAARPVAGAAPVGLAGDGVRARRGGGVPGLLLQRDRADAGRHLDHAGVPRHRAHRALAVGTARADAAAADHRRRRGRAGRARADAQPVRQRRRCEPDRRDLRAGGGGVDGGVLLPVGGYAGGRPGELFGGRMRARARAGRVRRTSRRWC